MNEGRIYHILLMAAYLWPEGQRVQKDPAEHVRQFIAQNYGEQTVADGMAVLGTLKSQNKMLADSGREDAIDAKLLNAGVNFAGLDFEKRMGLLAFYLGLAFEIYGSSLEAVCKRKLCTIAELLGLKQDEVDVLLDMTRVEEDSPKMAALSVLGLPPTQYRQQNLKIGNRNLKLETKKMQASLACIFLICWMNISALLHIPKFPVASHFDLPTAGNSLLL